MDNKTFDGTKPLDPISNISTSAVRAQSILLASLSVTIFVAFVAVLGKQWILYYTRATTWGNVANRGEQRQTKLVGLQKWRLELVMEFLPVMLQFALLLFAVAIVVYLWDLNAPVAQVVLVVTLIGTTFYIFIAALATFYSDCPFQTPLSVRLQNFALWVKKSTAPARVRLRKEATLLRSKVEHIIGTLTGGTNTPNHNGEGTPNDNDPVTLSDPTLWRDVPLFDSPAQEDVAASAGFWLLENSTSSSAASAVTAVFSKLQWPSCHPSITALVRLHDVYMESVKAPEDKSASLKALQSAAAYYVLYHTQFIWDALNCLKGGVVKLPPSLPPDLLRLHGDRWGREDVFEHLLQIEDRSEPFMSGQFLAYIAPYWVCGDSDGAMKFRPKRLETLRELIVVLEASQMLNPITLTDCILSVGVAVDFPIHPDDLIRIDKRCVPLPHLLTSGLIGGSDYLVQTFETVVEHTLGMAVVRGRRHHAKEALNILITLGRKATLPLVDATWIRKLLVRVIREDMDDDMFTLFLRLNAQRKEEDNMEDVEIPPGPCRPHNQEGVIDPESLFAKILRIVRTCSGEACGWKDEAVYGGLIVIRDIPRLGSFVPDNDSFGTLVEAMEKGKPFRVRKAAYDIIAFTREQWLRPSGSHQTLVNLEFPRKLHDIVIEFGRSNYQQSFLEMVEILSEAGDWHSHLRGAMDVWLSFRRERPDWVLWIVARIGGLPPPNKDDFNHPLEEFLGILVEKEWLRVPGLSVEDLAADRLAPLVEVTIQLRGIFTEGGRAAVLAAVMQVTPSLGRRQDGLGEGIPGTVEVLQQMLQMGANAIEGTGQPPPAQTDQV